jgi:hypothetical protein
MALGKCDGCLPPAPLHDPNFHDPPRSFHLHHTPQHHNITISGAIHMFRRTLHDRALDSAITRRYLIQKPGYWMAEPLAMQATESFYKAKHVSAPQKLSVQLDKRLCLVDISLDSYTNVSSTYCQGPATLTGDQSKTDDAAKPHCLMAFCTAYSQ